MSVSMRDMLKAGVHFGHRTRYWNPKMAPYIFGARNGVHIINLEKTLPMFEDAMKVVKGIAKKKGKVLFVGTKRSANKIIKEQAARCGMPYVNHRWLGGMLTNYKTIRKAIKRLNDLNAMFEKESFGNLKKKEVLMLTRERDKLERNLGGIRKMGGLPDALFVIDAKHEHIAVGEANKLKIPVISIIDTNTVPDNIDYIIPGNDDAMSAIRLYAGAVADIFLAAKTASASDEFVEVIEEEAPVKAAAKPAKVDVEKPVEAAEKPKTKDEG
jgi:small subunit ribosomal protein S2